MILVDQGKALAGVVIPEGASAANRFAAEELIKYVKAMSGAKLLLSTDRADLPSPAICVGPIKDVNAPGTEILIHDGYALKTCGGKLFIAGGNDRGILYGVYGFLEEVLGCRFFAQDAERIPSRGSISIPELDMTSIPPFEFRETSWHATLHADIACKRGLNGPHHGFEDNRGGAIRYWGFSHTLFDYVSPEAYFDTNPEYFSMINGVRISERTQLCLTNPEVLEIVKKKLRKNIADHPECKIFSLTQMDWYNPCECPDCAKVDAEEGGHAGTLLRFVNACAASIASEYPDVVIDTFAYQYTRIPPKVTKPLPNVCVRICSIECCFSHPLEECDQIAAFFRTKTPKVTPFQNDLRKWHTLHDHMYVWDYTTNFRHYLEPMPNLFVLQPNIKFFLQNGARGLYEQGNGESISGEFGELRSYLLCRLMWNPDRDVNQEINEFLTGYYGMAAAPIRTYIDLVNRYPMEHGIHVGIYDGPCHGHLPFSLLEEADALFDRAEAMADDPVILDRVQKSRLQIRYARLAQMEPGCEGFTAYCDAFITDLHRFGIQRSREWELLEFSEQKMRQGKTDDPKRWGGLHLISH